MLSVEINALRYNKEPGLYNTNPSNLRLTHLSVNEIAVHFWKNGLQGTSGRDLLNYRRVPLVNSVSLVCAMFPPTFHAFLSLSG